MLDLDDPRWEQLRHAYGSAADTPKWLRQLEANPNQPHSENRGLGDPWYELYSSICHQGSVYTASYAAVPHLVRIAGLASDPLPPEYFLLPAHIEQGRSASDAMPLPNDLKNDYYMAIKHLPALLPRIALADWDEPTTRIMASALAALKGHSDLADVIEMMDPLEIEAYYDYKDNE